MAHEPPMPTAGEVQTFFTPLNLILFTLASYIIYTRLRPSPPPILSHPEPYVFQTFTPRTLQLYNGVTNPRVLMGVEGQVFDVTTGRSFYGPGGPYSNFAGRDASRGLAKGSFDEEMITPVDQKLDLLLDLTEEERDSLRGWKELFAGKYLLVGNLVNEGEEEEEGEKGR